MVSKIFRFNIVFLIIYVKFFKILYLMKNTKLKELIEYEMRFSIHYISDIVQFLQLVFSRVNIKAEQIFFSLNFYIIILLSCNVMTSSYYYVTASDEYCLRENYIIITRINALNEFTIALTAPTFTRGLNDRRPLVVICCTII